jgi:hypothetical protein
MAAKKAAATKTAAPKTVVTKETVENAAVTPEPEVKQETTDNAAAAAEQKETAENKAATGGEVSVTVIQTYNDLRFNRIVEIGETFTADAARAAQLKGLMLVK